MQLSNTSQQGNQRKNLPNLQLNIDPRRKDRIFLKSNCWAGNQQGNQLSFRWFHKYPRRKPILGHWGKVFLVHQNTNNFLDNCKNSLVQARSNPSYMFHKRFELNLVLNRYYNIQRCHFHNNCLMDRLCKILSCNRNIATHNLSKSNRRPSKLVVHLDNLLLQQWRYNYDQLDKRYMFWCPELGHIVDYQRSTLHKLF